MSFFPLERENTQASLSPPLLISGARRTQCCLAEQCSGAFLETCCLSFFSGHWRWDEETHGPGGGVSLLYNSEL